MLNIWDLMLRCPRDAYQYKEVQETITELSQRGQAGQEISIGSTERGWVIKIHSCYTDMEVVILVPRYAEFPVEVVSDTRMTAKPYSGGRNDG